MDWINELRPILDIAFREGGNGLLWTIIGALTGLLASAILIGAATTYTFRTHWPTEAPWGTWSRWGLLAYSLLTIPTAFGAAGAGWGILKAVQDAINTEQVVEKATVQATSELVAILYVAFETNKSEQNLSEAETEALITEYLNNKTINVVDLQNISAEIEALLTDSIAELAHLRFNQSTEGATPGLAAFISKKVWTQLVKGEVDRILSYVDQVTIDVAERKTAQSNKTTVQEIAFSIGAVHLKPIFNREANKLRKATLILPAIQIALFVGIPVITVHYAGRHSKKGKNLPLVP